MGRDKALLRLNSGGLHPEALAQDTSTSQTSTLLDLMVDKLLALTILNEVVVCRNEPGFLQDIRPELGPVGALYTLSQHYPNSQALILPVDMPLLSAGILEQLLRQAETSDVALYFEGHHFPLMLRFTETVNQQLEHRLDNPDSDLSIARLLKDLDARKIIGSRDQLLFTNINTPAEWSALKQE